MVINRHLIQKDLSNNLQYISREALPGYSIFLLTRTLPSTRHEISVDSLLWQGCFYFTAAYPHPEWTDESGSCPVLFQPKSFRLHTNSLRNFLVQWVRVWHPVEKPASSLSLLSCIGTQEDTSMGTQFVRFFVCYFRHGGRVDKSEFVRFLRN